MGPTESGTYCYLLGHGTLFLGEMGRDWRIMFDTRQVGSPELERGIFS